LDLIINKIVCKSRDVVQPACKTSWSVQGDYKVAWERRIGSTRNIVLYDKQIGGKFTRTIIFDILVRQIQEKVTFSRISIGRRGKMRVKLAPTE
jgi:hypothetical protein